VSYLIKKPNYYRSLMMSFVLVSGITLTGSYSLNQYIHTIFKGIVSKPYIPLSAIIFGVVSLSALILAKVLIQRFERKKMFIIFAGIAILFITAIIVLSFYKVLWL
jgi:predicted MFS family arabinose efflux permease